MSWFIFGSIFVIEAQNRNANKLRISKLFCSDNLFALDLWYQRANILNMDLPDRVSRYVMDRSSFLTGTIS
jgi:hypothetical protein